MILECTDCKHCISYGGDFRIACGHPDLPAEEVFKYEPLFDRGDADRCKGFEDGESEVELRMDDIDKAVELYGDDITSLRKYAEKEVRDDRQELGYGNPF